SSLAWKDRLNAAVTMAPSRAIPKTPPSSRLVLVAADATPARWTGTDPITALVMGAMVRAMPLPITTIEGRMTVRYEDVGSYRRASSSPAPRTRVPAVMNHREPYRSESRPD